MIRHARPADAGEILRIYAPIVLTTPISFETELPSNEEIARRIRVYSDTGPWLVDERDGRVAGYAYAGSHRARAAYRWSVETSVFVDADLRTGGVGRGLYEALFRLLAEQGFARCFAGITLPNPASVGFHEALGFEPIGVFRRIGYKLDAWHDVGWWQRDLPVSDPPFPPVTLDRVKQEGPVFGLGVDELAGRIERLAPPF